MKIPSLLRRRVLHFESLIEDAVRRFSRGLDDGARLLDAGAGEGRYAKWFRRQRYVGVDLGVGDVAWNYHALDTICDLSALPFADGCFDAAVNIVTLEHVRDPGLVLREIARTLRPGGTLLLITPFEWEVHQEPHDYFRFTRFGLEYLLLSAGFERLDIQPAGGFFCALSRRLFTAIQFFTQGWRLLFLPLVAACLGPLALLAPAADTLDEKKAFTLGYICRARKADHQQEMRVK